MEKQPLQSASLRKRMIAVSREAKNESELIPLEYISENTPADFAVKSKRKQLEKAEKRIHELDRLFVRTYEDNVAGKLSDERFAAMSQGYEEEQQSMKEAAEVLRQEICAPPRPLSPSGRGIPLPRRGRAAWENSLPA